MITTKMEEDLSFDEKKEEIPTLLDASIDPSLSQGNHKESEKEEEESFKPFARKVIPKKKENQFVGLSELSKQLRIYQAKNDTQGIEINRLERQLKILADLQGISVADLRRALEEACANEAFAEMQQRVASLRAQLEAAHLTKLQELKKDQKKTTLV